MKKEILAQIIAEKRKEIDRAKAEISQDELREGVKILPARRKFRQAISRPHQINLIAEIKHSSPSKGVIRENFEPVNIALTYEANGASALSILTDEKFFGGSLSCLEAVREKCSLPILRKDFIVDEYQIYQSAYSGSDAILLIAAVLSPEEITAFLAIAADLGIEVMLEVHSEEDLEKALNSDAQIIGINNRDLSTFEVNLDVTSRLIRLIPKDRVIVSESGINSHEQVMFLKSLGVHAVLIGEAFMASNDIAARMRKIMEQPKRV